MSATASPARAATFTVRPYTELDRPAVVEVFFDTLALGRAAPIDRHDPISSEYASLCLDWYLTDGAADVTLVEVDSRLAGYALVAVDADGHERWIRRHSLRFAASATCAVLAGRLPRDARRFFALRVRDAATLMRSGRHTDVESHAHLNVRADARSATVARILRDEIDAIVRRAGHLAWSGEINAPVGRRTAALERAGFTVVGRDPNHTLSWLRGAPVERLTVVRTFETSPQPAD